MFKMFSNSVIARMISPSQILFKGHQGDDQIICDRTLLSEKSLFFKNLFGSPLEFGRNEYEIKDVSFDNLARVVNFTSTTQINLDGDNLLELLSVSIYLAVPSLEELCKQNLISHADPQDYCMIFKFANRNRLPEFSSQMLTLIHEHAAEVLEERSFLECDVDEMISVIESDALTVEDEGMCWNAIKEWYTHDATNRRADFIRLLELVRFPLIQEPVLAAIAKYCQDEKFLNSTVTPFLDNALQMRKDPYRAFEISHPKYHLRNNEFQHGLIVFNGSEVTPIPLGTEEDDDRVDYYWRTDEVNDMVGLFDPVTQKTKWLHEVPKNIRPEFACRSLKGDLFIATSSYNPCVPNNRVLKYCIERDSWDVVGETDRGIVQGMSILDRVLYVFHAWNWKAQTFMTRQNISTYPAPEVPGSREILPFQFTCGTNCVVHGGCIYVLGCKPYSSLDTAARQVFCFVPETCIWSRKADCPVDLLIRDRVCAHPSGMIYALTTFVDRDTGTGPSQLWSYDTPRDFWNILPVLTRKTVCDSLGMYIWNDKLVFKDRFCRYGMDQDYEELRATPAALLVSCPHETLWMACPVCRDWMSIIEVYDLKANKTVANWVVGSREAGELKCGIAYRIRKSSLRERKDDVRVVKTGNEPGVPITLEELTEQLRLDPPTEL